MMTPEEYLGRVRATVWRAGDYLPAERLEEAHHLIEHGEPAEGLSSLAWVIVSDRVCVPLSIIRDIRKYSEGLVPEQFMPANLDDYALPDVE